MSARHVIASERAVGRGSGAEARDLAPATLCIPPRSTHLLISRPPVPRSKFP